MDREPPRPEETEVTFHHRALPARVFAALLCVALLMVALDVLLNRSRIVPHRAFRRLFNIAYDNSLAGWFATSQALVTSLLAAGVGLLRTMRGFPGEGRGWMLVGLLFLYLSADDGAKIHERIGTTVDKASSSGAFSFLEGYPSYTWQVTVGPLLACAVLLAAFFLWRRLEQYGLRPFLVAAVLCLAAAVTVDIAEGVEGLYRQVAEASGLRHSFVSHYLRSLEEFLEMAGMSTFLATFLAVLLRNVDGVTFRLRRE